MKTVTIREKLHDYIRSADDKKVKAMYTLLIRKDEDTGDDYENPLDDDAFVAELDKEYDDLESGRVKGYTLDEVMQHLDEARKQRYGI